LKSRLYTEAAWAKYLVGLQNKADRFS